MKSINLKNILRLKDSETEFEFGSLIHDCSTELGLVIAVVSMIMLLNH